MTWVLVFLLEHQLGVKSPQLPVSKADLNPRTLKAAVPRCGTMWPAWRCGLGLGHQTSSAQPGQDLGSGCGEAATWGREP